MNLVNEYLDTLEEPKKSWVSIMVNCLREVFPELEESFSRKMPTYKGNNFYIAFAAQKNYFSFYTDDISVLPLIKELVPSVSLGKSCARIKYSNESAIEALIDACKVIVDSNKSKQPPSVSDMEGIKKWSKVSPDIQQLLINNVFCAKCGVTKIVNYGIHNDRFGVVLKGYCKNCGGRVARLVEEE